MAIKETIPFNFDELYTNVEQKFKDKGYDVEEGSNTMQLATAMSYLVSMLNTNTAVNINENILSLARKRNNVLQDARILGYEIEHTKSYKYDLYIKRTDSQANFSIPRHSIFECNNKQYYYMGNTITASDLNDKDLITITVIEGTLYKFLNNTELDITIDEEYYIDVPYTNVEEDGLEVYLTYVTSEGLAVNNEEWSKSDKFMIEKDTHLNKEYIRLDSIEYRTPRLYFKIGDTGNDLRPGTNIQINALISSGADGSIGLSQDDLNILNLTPEIKTVFNSSISNMEITAINLNREGADEESIESIKNNAPLFHNSANRTVTKTDYIAFSNRQAAIKYSSVWDGNEEAPTRPGYIWFSYTPNTYSRSFTNELDIKTFVLQNALDSTNNFLESNEIQEVFSLLDEYKIPTLQFIHRNPIYVDFNYEIEVVKYSISKTEDQINSEIFDVINNYFLGVNEDSPMEIYDIEYFQSNLIKRIDSELTDVTGINLSLQTKIQLFKEQITEEFDYKVCKIILSEPYEGIFDVNGDIIINNLPNIDTTDFIGLDNLILNTTLVSGGTAGDSYSIFDIELNGAKVGEYKIFNTGTVFIEITFFINSAGGYTTGIDEVNFDELELNLVYKSPNIKFIRNTLPRLNSVKFI